MVWTPWDVVWLVIAVAIILLLVWLLVGRRPPR